MGDEDKARGAGDAAFDGILDPQDFDGLGGFIDFEEPAAEEGGAVFAGEEAQNVFSPEDLFAAAMADVPQDDEEDLQEVEALIGKLRRMGYTCFDFDYEVLSSLEKRGQYFEEEAVNIFAFADELAEFLEQLMQVYAGSKASMQVGSSSRRTQSLQANLLHASEKLNKGAVNSIYNTIQEILIGGGVPEVSDVYDRVLRTSPALGGSAEFMQKELLQFISTAIPVITKDFTKEQKTAVYQDGQRRNKAQILFPEERETLLKISETGAERISFVRQVKKAGKSFYLKCPECGSEFPVSGSFVTIIAFPTESGPVRRMFPRLVSCRCGRGFLFTQEDYLQMLKSYLAKNASGLTNVLHSSTSFCKGASFLRINPPASVIEEALPGVVYAEAEGNVDAGKPAMQGKEAAVGISVDDTAFRDAAKQFYLRLREYKGRRQPAMQGVQAGSGGAVSGAEEWQEKSAGPGFSGAAQVGQEGSGCADSRLTYEEMAFYFCECLSLDYRTVKNRALFSLISYLNENEHLATVLDCKRLFGLKNSLVLLEENLGSIEKIPYDRFVELASLNQSLGGKHRVTEDSMENRRLLYESLLEKTDALAEMINKLELNREAVLAGLEKHKAVLGFCRMLNIATIKLNDLNSMITDERIFKLFSEVADRMIVNNYAEQFYGYWSMLRIVRKSVLQEHLTRSSGQAAMRNGLLNILKKTAETAGSASILQCADRFEVCYLMSSDLHKKVGDLYRAYLDVNFYRFCVCYKQIPADLKMFMGKAYGDDFFHFVCEFDRIASRTLNKSEYGFFLQDFSPAELEGNDRILSELDFGRYVLVRRDNESLQDYVKRWYATPYHDFCRYDVYDNARLFDCLMPWISVVVTCPMLYLAGYKSYAVATFITTLAQVLSGDAGPVDGSPWLALGISESHLAVIRSSLEEYRLLPDKYKCCLPEDACRVTSGYYFSSAGAAVNDMCTRYENVIVRDTFDLNCLESLFSVREEICSILNHGSYLNEDGEPANDEEDIAGEILCYVKDKNLRKLVEGK